MFCLCLLFLSLQNTLGMIESFALSLEHKDSFSVIWSFEFAAQGVLDINIALTQPPVSRNDSLQFLLCTDHQGERCEASVAFHHLMDLLRASRFQDVCAREVFDYLVPERQMNLGFAPFTMQHSWHVVTTDTMWLRLLQLNCHEEVWNVQIDLVAVNPNGEYLSMSEVPYKLTWLVTACTWAGVLILWCLNWVPYRYFNTKLHRLLSMIPVVYIIWAILQTMLWREQSKTGLMGPAYLTYLGEFLNCVCTGVLFGCFIALSKGLGVTKPHLRDSRRVWVLIVLLMIATGIYETFGGFLLFFLVIIYVLILRFIFASIVENLALLGSQAAIVRTMDVQLTVVSPVQIKMKMFKKFQLTMIIFLAVDVIFQLWATIFLRSTPWVEVAINQSIYVLTVGVVYLTFRMRPFVPYVYRVVGHEEAENMELNRGRERSRARSRELPLMLDVGTSMWRPGRPYPSLSADANFAGLGSDAAPIFLVKNPSQKSGGTMVARTVYDFSMKSFPDSPSS